jgi:hypothetical protein
MIGLVNTNVAKLAAFAVIRLSVGEDVQERLRLRERHRGHHCQGILLVFADIAGDVLTPCARLG